jgi:hypothetical protein
MKECEKGAGSWCSAQSAYLRREEVMGSAREQWCCSVAKVLSAHFVWDFVM